ncbi:MAG: sialidase, partial [Frankiales bacterium]|nr:sialidase [Frankiales bacterium]
MTAFSGGLAAQSAPPGARRRVIVLALLAILLPVAVVVSSANHAQAATLLSQGKPTTASSSENASFTAAMATDGNTGTRWGSAFSDPQWLQVDLGSSQSITQVVLNWEAAYGKSFQIQTSADAATWTTIYTTTAGTGGVQTLNVTGTGRYVRMYGTARGTAYGYSLWEFQVFGGTPPPPACGTANVAQGKAATSSSTETAGVTPNLA